VGGGDVGWVADVAAVDDAFDVVGFERLVGSFALAAEVALRLRST
jgi:hypothetical protein